MVKLDDAGIRETLRRLSDLTPGLEIVGSTVVSSVRKNFETGGRPEKWPESLAARIEGRKTLVKQGFAGGLLGSINYRVEGRQVTVGTNKIHAAVHQFGVDMQVKIPAHSRRLKSRNLRAHGRIVASGVGFWKAHGRHMLLPARPFLVVQDEDWTEIGAALARHITGKK